MNYGFWLLMGQSAQTSVMAAQMRQLGGIQDELTLQRLAQQYQSILAQVLFETEQSARQITALASHDGFAAGIHARLRLNALQDIHPGLFDRYETKRAWAAATEQLNALWSVVDTKKDLATVNEHLGQLNAFLADPAGGQLLDQVAAQHPALTA